MAGREASNGLKIFAICQILSFLLSRVSLINVFIFCCFISVKDTVIDVESKVNPKYSIF